MSYLMLGDLGATAAPKVVIAPTPVPTRSDVTVPTKRRVRRWRQMSLLEKKVTFAAWLKMTPAERQAYLTEMWGEMTNAEQTTFLKAAGILRLAEKEKPLREAAAKAAATAAAAAKARKAAEIAEEAKPKPNLDALSAREQARLIGIWGSRTAAEKYLAKEVAEAEQARKVEEGLARYAATQAAEEARIEASNAALRAAEAGESLAADVQELARLEQGRTEMPTFTESYPKGSEEEQRQVHLRRQWGEQEWQRENRIAALEATIAAGGTAVALARAKASLSPEERAPLMETVWDWRTGRNVPGPAVAARVAEQARHEAAIAKTEAEIFVPYRAASAALYEKQMAEYKAMPTATSLKEILDPKYKTTFWGSVLAVFKAGVTLVAGGLPVVPVLQVVEEAAAPWRPPVTAESIIAPTLTAGVPLVLSR